MPSRRTQHMHIYIICFKSACSSGMQNQWVANISGQESKAAVLPELLGEFPTKAVNDTALKESISLCSIHWQRMDLKDETHTHKPQASAFKTYS